MNFTGATGEYLEFDNSLGQVSFPFTMTMWYRPQTTNRTQCFLETHDQSNGYIGIRWFYEGGDISVSLGNGSNTSPSGRWGFGAPFSFNVNQWYHLAVTFSSPTQAVLWVNGNPISFLPRDGTGTQSLAWDNTIGRIGSSSAGNPVPYLDAEIDEFTFWDRSFNTFEIRDIMCHKLVGNEPDLRLNYRFDGSGNTIINSATGPDLNIIGNTTRVNSSAPVGDRSVHNNHIAGRNAVGFTSTNDSVTISPGSGGAPGTHIFFVDQPPVNTNGITLPSSVNNYWGVFNANRGQIYLVEVTPRGPLSNVDTNQLELATRGNNHFSGWNLTGDRNTYSIFSSTYNNWAHFVLAENPDYVHDNNSGDDDGENNGGDGSGDPSADGSRDQSSLGCYVLFPSAFTPNGDGLNDFFGPGTTCDFDAYQLQIFNRWGEQVFSTDDWEVNFDGFYRGRRLPEGTYVYKVEFTVDGEYQQESGYVSILP